MRQYSTPIIEFEQVTLEDIILLSGVDIVQDIGKIDHLMIILGDKYEENN